MAEDQKNIRKEFQSFCDGMPCADMMRKMMEAKKAGSSFNCAEMVSHMMEIFAGAKEKKETPAQGA